MSIIVGFAGVAIIVRPGFEGFSVYSLVALVCVAFCTGRDLATRRIPERIPTLLISTATVLAVSICGAFLVQPMGGWTRAFSHIEVAPILTVGSGTPVNVVTGGDDNRSRVFPFTSRPLGLSRNTERLPSSATLDLRILKYFVIKPHGKLDVVVEAFNVLNRTNVSQINTVFGRFLTPSRGFERPIEAGAARQIQFSIDFEF